MLENSFTEECNNTYTTNCNNYKHSENFYVNKILKKVSKFVKSRPWSSWTEQDQEELISEATLKIYKAGYPPFEENGKLTPKAMKIINNCRIDYYRKYLKNKFVVDKIIRRHTYFVLVDRFPNTHQSLFSNDHSYDEVGQDVDEADYASSDNQFMDEFPSDNKDLGKYLFSSAVFSRDSHSCSPSEELECDQRWDQFLLVWQTMEQGADKDVLKCILEGEHDRHEIAAKTGRKLSSVSKAKTTLRKKYGMP